MQAKKRICGEFGAGNWGEGLFLITIGGNYIIRGTHKIEKPSGPEGEREEKKKSSSGNKICTLGGTMIGECTWEGGSFQATVSNKLSGKMEETGRVISKRM